MEPAVFVAFLLACLQNSLLCLLVWLQTSKVVHNVSVELEALSLEVVCAVSSEAVHTFSLARLAFDSGQGHPLLR